MTWRHLAACADTPTHIFYPPKDADAPKGRNAPTVDTWAKARAVCDRCPVQNDCLKEAITTGDTEGYRANHTPDDLDRIVRNQRGDIPKVCGMCGGPFHASWKASNARYCGAGCSKVAQREARRRYNRKARGAVA